MAAIITEDIQTRPFELIRDRIAQILADELANQATLKGDSSVKAKVFVDRFEPVSYSEGPVVVIHVDEVDYIAKNQITKDAVISFNIDTYNGAKQTQDKTGHTLAAIKRDRLSGLIHYILEHWEYNTLRFPRPFIEHTKVESITATAGENKDMTSVLFSRIRFVVRAPDMITKKAPVTITGFETQAILGLTDKGYLYSVDSSVTPVEPVCARAVLEVNGDEFLEIDSGATFNLVIVDTNGTPRGTRSGNTIVVPAPGAAPIDIDINGTSFITGASTDQDVSVVSETGSNPVGSPDGNNWQISDSTISNSDNSYSVDLAAEQNLNLPDITHTDSNGNSVTRPAQTPMVCTPGISGIAYVRNTFNPNDGESTVVGSSGWYMANTQIHTYNVAGQCPVLDPNNNDRLLTQNAFGNTWRITNDRGGRNFTDVGGGLTSDGATANYLVDNYTGKGWYGLDFHSGTMNWDSTVTGARNFTLTAYDGTSYGSTDYGQFHMPEHKDIQNILTGTGANSNIIRTLSNWGTDVIAYIMYVTPNGTACYFWRENQSATATNIFQTFSRTTVNSGISGRLVRNHF